MNSSSQGYDISAYGNMIDDNRVHAYVEALKAAIQPGAVVLELGTGTGFFATLACKLGASRVYAIEPDDAIYIAQQVAKDNGCADKIQFIQALSTQVDLPEKADVIFSDMRGVLPLFQEHIPSIIDARQRFLAANARQIPISDTIWMTLINDPATYQKYYVSPWCDQPYNCIFTANLKYVTNNWRRTRLTPAQILVEPQILATLNYTSSLESNIKSTLAWQVTEPGTVHGIGAWFDTTLLEGIGFSNAPGQPKCIYGNAFFPFTSPIDLMPGDQVIVNCQAKLVAGDYIWSWQTQVFDSSNPSLSKVNFQQSTFFGIPFSPQTLKKRADSFTPSLNELGQVDALILNAMHKAQPLGEIAQQVSAQFPQRFPTIKQALSYVGHLSVRYSQ